MMRFTKRDIKRDPLGGGRQIDETFEEEDGTLYVYRNGDYTTPISVTLPHEREYLPVAVTTDKTSLGPSTVSNKIDVGPKFSLDAFKKSLDTLKIGDECEIPSIEVEAINFPVSWGDDDLRPAPASAAPAVPRPQTPIGRRKIVP
jgi:hypothetical protein